MVLSYDKFMICFNADKFVMNYGHDCVDTNFILERKENWVRFGGNYC